MISPPLIADVDYINFLVAAQCDVSCVKAAECFSQEVMWFPMIHSTASLPDSPYPQRRSGMRLNPLLRNVMDGWL